MATYDFSASVFFSVEADSLKEAYAKAGSWRDENMQVAIGYDVDVQFEKLYDPYGKFPDSLSSKLGKVPAHVDYQVWVGDYAVQVGSAEFDCSLVLDELDLEFVGALQSGLASYRTDDLFYFASAMKLVEGHDGPFSCYIDDQDMLDRYLANRVSAS